MRHFFDSFPTDAHPMAVLASGVVGMSTFYPDSQNIFDADAVEITINRLIAKLPTLAAWSFKKAIGQPYVYPRNDLGYAANLLHMMFAVPTEDYEVDPGGRRGARPAPDPPCRPRAERLRLDGSARRQHACQPLRLDQRRHQRAVGSRSTAGPTRRSSTRSSGSCSDGGDVQRWVDRAKDPDHSFRLAGFGHRVYKNFDPRATIIKKAADRVLAATGADDGSSRSPSGSRKSRSTTSTSSSRKLYPNVDFYSGLIYRAIGFPKNMFTNCFAIGRLPGWIAQWQEMIESPETKIGRPRQVYIGPPTSDYAPIEQRMTLERRHQSGSEPSGSPLTEVNAAYAWAEWPDARSRGWRRSRQPARGSRLAIVTASWLAWLGSWMTAALHASLWDVIVRPDHRRRGVGTALTRAALDRCADRGWWRWSAPRPPCHSSRPWDSLPSHTATRRCTCAPTRPRTGTRHPMRVSIMGRSPASPNPTEACAGYLVEGGEARILVDIGPGVVSQLVRRHRPDELDAIVVSHMHADHMLDLVTLRYVYPWRPLPQDQRLRVIMPPGSAEQMLTSPRALATRVTSRIASGCRARWLQSVQLREAVSDPDRDPALHPVLGTSGSRRDGRLLAYTADTAPCETWPASRPMRTSCSARRPSGRWTRMPTPPEPRGHLTPAEAGATARDAGAGRLLLTHLPVNGDGSWAPTWPRRRSAARWDCRAARPTRSSRA